MDSVVEASNATTAGAEELTHLVCYNISKTTKDLAWDGDNTLDFNVFPSLLLQIIFVVLLTRTLAFLLKPLGQPRVFAEILGGLIMGPSVLGNWKWFADTVFPYKSLHVLETMSNLGLVYFMFVVGVQMDLSMIKHTGKKAATMAISGMIVPFIIGMILAKSIDSTKSPMQQLSFQLFYGVVLSATAFPVLARVLAELKLLNTELGEMAMSCGLLTDVLSWLIFAAAVAIAVAEIPYTAALGLMVNYISFILICLFIIRPSVHWISRRTPDGEKCKEVYLCIVIIGLFLCGFVTDFFGVPALFGAFVYGLVIPIGPLGAALVDNFEDFVYGLLLPLFFTVSGLSTDLKILISLKIMHWARLLVVIILSCGAKVGILLLLAICYKMPIDEGLALGLLMNTKGVTEIIMLSIGRGQDIIDSESFTIMVTVSLVTTCLVTPILLLVYKPGRPHVRYNRTIQAAKHNSELRVLTCLHTHRNVRTTINLLETFQHNKSNQIYVYALHLMELTDRESSMLIIHNRRKPGGAAVNQAQAQSNNIISAIEVYKQQGGILPIQPITSISPFSTMHQDICNIAEDKRASFIIIPFHKHQTIDGAMECTNPEHQTINQNVLVNAPCSVGILVDRGLSSLKRVDDHQISHHVVVLFFGGADAREALSYALRMAENPAIGLTIIRFLPGEEAIESPVHRYHRDENGIIVKSEDDKEKKTDDKFINSLLKRNLNQNHISFTEKIVNNGVETVDFIRSMESIYDLYIVGRDTGASPLTSGLTDWSECPELGVIGDILASSDFALTVSILVVQQYMGMGIHDGISTPNSSAGGNDFFINVQVQ